MVDQSSAGRLGHGLRADLPRMAGLALSYALIARLSLLFFSTNNVVAMIWPASGLALAGLLLGGRKWWPAVFIGAFAANGWSGNPPVLSLVIACGNTFEALLAVALLQSHGFDLRFNRARDFLNLLAVAAASALCGAVVGTSALLLTVGPDIPAGLLNLLHWWLGDLIGMLLVTPLILLVRQPPDKAMTRRRLAEILLFFGLTVLAGQVVLLGWLGQHFRPGAPGFMMFMFIVWSAMRYGRHGTALAIGMIALQSLLGAALGIGLFQADLGTTRLLHLWLYIFVCVLAGMPLALLLHERRLAAAELMQKHVDLVQSEARFETLLQNLPVGVIVHAPDTRITFSNLQASHLLGLSREQMQGKVAIDPTWSFVHENGIPYTLDEYPVNAVITSRQPIRNLVAGVKRPDRDEPEWLLANAFPEFDTTGELRQVIVTFISVTDRKVAELRVEYLARHDPLTGLPNRLLMQDRAEQAIVQAHRHGTRIALLLLDLDNFKTLNDTLGHPMGDTLLKEVALRLKGCLRDADSLCRQGGDEFLLMLPDLSDADDLIPMLLKIMDRLQQPFFADGHEVSTSVSIGATLFPDDGDGFDTLMKNADLALYRAKDSGRNTYRFFDDGMNREVMEHVMLRNGIRRGLPRGEFLLHYQPQIDLASGHIVGAEALVRWNHPELGMLPPGRFIPVAEETGLIVPLGDWVMTEACRQAAAWQRAGLPPLTMAVNLSALQFKRGAVEQAVHHALQTSGLPPSQLELELTESILIQKADEVLATVRRLKDLGVKLSIDDFGTGYSSLSYLKRFAVDKLKIDQSFVRDMSTDPDDAVIVHTIIQMARSLNLRTVAEGVEGPDALVQLIAGGCDEAQGYHFARPMPAADFATLLAGPQPWSTQGLLPKIS